MKVAEYVIEFLTNHGVKDIFFVEGSACASLVVAASNHPGIRYWCPLHEQAGAFMADGYYKTTRRLTAMIATSGPGGQNLLNGIAASYYDSIPSIFITGNINSRFMKPNNLVRQHGFQENDIVSMAKPITKYATIIKDPMDIGAEMYKAYAIATLGRPGPVLIDIPMDIQKKELPKDYAFTEPECGPSKYDVESVRTCLEMMLEAKRPAILLGGGVWLADAVESAKRLADALRTVPFFVTWNMIDYYDPEHYGGRVGTFGGSGRNFGIQNCDFLLTIGSRISGRITGGMIDTFTRAAKKVVVDLDSDEMKYSPVPRDMSIVSDAGVFMDILREEYLRKVGDGPYWDSAWLTQVKAWLKSYPVAQPEYWHQKNSVNPYVFVKVLSECLEEGDMLIHEAGGNAVVTSQAFEPKPGQRVFSNNGNSSLGYALPAAIGAAVATKNRVICITGDGGLNFNIQEFQTLKHHNLPVKMFIFDNRAFGITKLFRDTNFKSDYAGVDAQHGVSFPDFIKVARAYGLKGVYIRDHDELRTKIKRVLKAEGPVVCSVNMVGFYDYKPRLGWRSPIEDQYPFLPRDEFRKNMFIEPLSGWETPQYP